MNLRRTKHIWLPVLLLLYLGIMAWQGIDILTVQKDYVRYFGTIAAEITVIVALSFFLRKKYLLKQSREQS